MGWSPRDASASLVTDRNRGNWAVKREPINQEDIEQEHESLQNA